MQIQNLYDIFIQIDELYEYLDNKGMAFNMDGFPVFSKEMFLDEWPDIVVPYSQRKNKVVVDRKRTLVCHFDKDHRLYPRLSKLL